MNTHTLKEDENEIVNEFYYDIDASYIDAENFFDLMIECKYRDPSTDWIFIPENYGGMNEIESHTFLNPVDHFTKNNKFSSLDFEPLGALCGKGIEITSNGQSPKTITQAISQLSYAMAGKVVSAMEHQIDESLTTYEIIFYNVPIIVTTANISPYKSYRKGHLLFPERHFVDYRYSSAKFYEFGEQIEIIVCDYRDMDSECL